MVYAIKDDLAEYLGCAVEELPAEANDRLLKRASELIKTFTRDNIMVENAPAEVIAAHLEAAKNATCAQVEYWLEMHESFAIQPDVKNVNSGDVKVEFVSTPDQLAKRARSFLNAECLLYRGLKPPRTQTWQSGYYL